MDLFSIIVAGLKEAERLSQDSKVPARERAAAVALADALKTLKGPAFLLREYHQTSPSTQT